MKTEDTIYNYIQNNCFFNLSTHFKNPEEWVFELTDSSEVINKGKSSNIIDDIMNQTRIAPNDIGCYEFQ